MYDHIERENCSGVKLIFLQTRSQIKLLLVSTRVKNGTFALCTAEECVIITFFQKVKKKLNFIVIYFRMFP